MAIFFENDAVLQRQLFIKQFLSATLIMETNYLLRERTIGNITVYKYIEMKNR